MKKGKSRKCACRKNFIKSQKRSGRPFNSKHYDKKAYDGSQNQDEET